jgi:hypothetical protein
VADEAVLNKVQRKKSSCLLFVNSKPRGEWWDGCALCNCVFFASWSFVFFCVHDIKNSHPIKRAVQRRPVLFASRFSLVDGQANEWAGVYEWMERWKKERK